MKKNALPALALIVIAALGPEHFIISLLFTAMVIAAWKSGVLRS